MGKMKYSGRWINFARATVLVLAARRRQRPIARRRRCGRSGVEAAARMNFVYRGLQHALLVPAACRRSCRRS